MEYNTDLPLPTRRKFDSPWDELNYTYRKLLYWFYNRENRSKSLLFAKRMIMILKKIPDIEETIKGNECLALINEVYGNWLLAAEYRKKEIDLIYRLRDLAKTEKPLAKERILKDFTPEDIADRYDLLAIELWRSGNFQEALLTLDKSEKICSENGFEFDGGNLRRDIEEEIGKVLTK